MRRGLIAAAMLLVAAAATAQNDTEVSYTDDFQSYATPSDPPGWIDNPVGTPRREADGLFKAWPDPLAASNIVYGTKQASGQPDGNTPRIGSFSTLMTRDFSGRGRFEYRGRMLRTTADARIGLTFFSAYSDVDAYYLVGLWSRPSGGLSMQLHGFGAGVLSGTTDSGFVPDPNVWYRFVIQADDTGGETRIRVRFWRDGTPEPSTFAIEAVDAAATRRTSGKIGMWAAVRGDAYVDDISAKSPVDHTAPVITVLESGNPLADGSKFNRDAVPEIRVTDDLSSFDYTATLDGASYTSLTPVTADGWHTLVVNAVDGPGNAAELTLRFLVDKTAPVVAILESGKPLPSGFAFNRDVIVTANVVDATNTTVVATLDGQPYVPGTPITAEGDHAIAVTATDEVGWSTTAGPIPFTIDKTAPAVTFTSHTDGQILTTARATISGGSGDAVLVSVSGVPATLDTATRTFVTSERALLEGENVLTFTAQDRAGNIGAATLRLIVDTRPPAVTIDTPASNACVDATTLQVTGSAADARLASVKVTVGQTSVAATLTGNNWTATVPVAEEGSAIVTVEATDSVGHTLSASRTLTVDRTAPVLDVRENGAEFTATIVNRAVSFFIRATDADSTVAPVATLDGQPYAAGTAVGNEGQHRLVVRATDCAGHVTEKTFDFTIDLTPPAIRNLQPENGGSTGTMPSSIRGTTDADAVRVELAAPAVGVEPAADGSFVIAAPFEEGTNRFTITARDRAGNSSSVDYSLRVKTTGPIVEIRESGSPMVSGTLFNRVVTPMIRTSETDATITATLNNAAFASGTAISNDGAYTLRATATDTLGHSVTEEVTFTIDRTPPVVKIESPLSGPATTESVEVRGSAGDAISAAVNGQAVSLDANGRFVLPSLVLNIGPNPIVATGRDQAGNIGRDEVLLTRDALGSGIIITYPPDRSRTNRATTDVVGRVLTPGRASSVTIGTRAVAVDATGGFRLSGYELIEGENTIRATAASADGTSNFAETRVTADFTPPSLTIRESGQPLSDGARFATQAVLTVDAADAGGGAVTTTLTIDGSGANPPATITREGGHAVIAVATDLAGNQTRAERTLFIGESSASGGCALSGFDPADRAVILASQTALVGRTGGAAGVKVNGVAATLADGSFFATVELPVEGDNAIRISCTDAAGVEIGTAVTITLQRVTGQPSITINSPAEDFVSAEETMTVSGTVGPGVVSADVNGVPATITGDDVGATRPFTVAGVRLSSGLNLLAARGRNAGGRTATASRRGLYIKDAPAVQISAPVPNLTTGVPSVAVSGTYTTLDPASLVVENLSTGSSAAAQYVRTSDTTGRWSVASVSLADGEQTLRVSGRDRLNRPATASVAVRLVAGYPTISITQPADQSWFGGAQESVTVAGAFQAAPGSAVDVNGVVATVNGNEYSAPVKFSTLAGGVTPIVARVTQPGGASAAAMITVRQLVAAPQVIESFPAPDAAAVDPGALLLVLFSQPMDVASVNAAFRLEDASGSPVTGARFLDRDVLTFAPATLLAPGRYTLRVAASATNLAGTPLAEPYSSAFTVAATAPLTPPVLAPLPASVCGDTISIEGTAAAGARVRLESGALTLSTTADSNGAFSFTYPISGQSGYALVRVRVVASDGSVSPAAERQVRVDCSGPQVLNAVYDRMVNQLTITFSEPVDSASLTSGSSVVMTLADGRAVGGTIAVSNNNALLTPSEDLTGKTFTLSITTAVRDVLGNPLVAPYSQQFAIGGEQPAAGDGSGFISGEVYDATTGRPLTGATIAIDVASPLPVTTTTDARGRYVARLPEGAHTIEASLSNYTTVWRGIIVPAGAGVIPIDIRLTRRGAAQTPAGSAITLTHGGDTAVTRRAELAIASGALQSGATVALTSIGGQALTGLLPLGWSPIAAAEVRLENASTLAAQLTFDVPASEIAAASQNLTAVQYDSSRDEWRVVTPVVNVSSTGAATFPLSRAGTFALVYPDRAPLVTPALPAAGDVLRGVPAAAPDAPALVERDFSLDPPIVLPDGRAVATLRIEGSGARYPSGTAVQAYIDEELRLADGSRLLDPPFAADLLLYRSLSGDLGVAQFHLAPTPRAAQVVLETGVDRIRVFPYPGRLDRGTLIGTEGGPVPADDRVKIEIPSGAVPEPLRATAASLTATDLQSLGSVAGFRVVGGFQLTLQRVTAPAPIDLDGDGVSDAAGAPELFLPARATYSVDASQLPSAGAQIVLAEVVDQTPFGRTVRLAVPMTRVSAEEGTTVVRFTTQSIDRSQLPVDGVAREGRYLVLAAESPVAFATGTVRIATATGNLLVGAQVSAPPLGLADVTRATGIYNVVVPSAPATPFQLVPRHVTTGEGAPYTHASSTARDAIVRVDLALAPQPPQLREVVVMKGEPPSQAALSVGSVTRDVALTTNIRASFSPGIDPSSVSAESITVTDAVTGSRVSGAASADGTLAVVWTLTAGQTLQPNGRYVVVVAPTIRGTNGAVLGRGASFTFETVQQVLNTEIRRERIRITIPTDDGVSRITGDPGALPAGWQAVAVRRGRDFNVRYQATAAGDGSFSFFIGNGGDANDRITIGDLVDLRVVNSNGALAAIFALTPFASEDGKSFVVPAGAAVRYTTPEGLTLDVPAGAFDVPTVISVNAATKQEFLDIEAFEAENEFLGSVNIEFDGVAKKPLRFEAPIPAGFDPAGKTLVLAQKMMSPRGPRLAIIDLMAAQDGKLVTDHGESTNASAVRVGSGLRPETNQTLTGSKFTRYLQMLIRSGVYSYHDIRQPVGGAVGWAVMEGLQANYDLMWDIFFSYFIPHIHVFERGGALLPIVTGKRFTVVGIDAGTGLQGFSRTYDPIPFGPPGTITPIEPAQQNDGGPYPVFGSPFRVEMLDLEVEEVEMRSIRNFVVRLENGTVYVTPGTPALPSDTKVTLLNVSKGSSQTSTAGASMQLPAEPGNRIVLLIEERQVDPTTPISIVFNEPIYVVNPNDPEAVNFALQEFMKVEHAPKPAGGAAPNYTDITRQVRFSVDSGERRVNLQFPSALQSNALYRLTLKEDIADSFNGNPELTLGTGTVDNNGVLTPVGGGTPLELHFSVRSPAGQLGSFTATPNGMIRGMELSGNLLFVAAWDGGLRAYDVSNPAALTGSPASVGEIPGPPTFTLSHLAVTIDRHDRIYTTAHLPIAGLFRSYRVEEFKGGYQDIPVRGSKIINWVLGYSSMIGLPSNTVLSDVPESIPFRIKVVLQDDETNFVDRKAFVAGTGASESGDFPLHDMKSYTVSIGRDSTPYKIQRITIENLSLDMKWSADAKESGPAVFTNVVARSTDRLRLIRNQKTFAIVAHLGHGIGVYDANAIESNRASTTSTKLREQLVLTAGLIRRDCSPATPTYGIVENYITTDAELRGAADGTLYSYSTDPHRGVLDLHLRLPSDQTAGTRDDDCDQRDLQDNTGGLLFRSAPEGMEADRMKQLKSAFSAAAGRQPYGHVSQLARFFWSVPAHENPFGVRGTTPGQAAEREYLLVASHEWGLVVVDIDSNPLAVPLFPLWNDNIADIIWIPGGAVSVRVYQSANIAVVGDRYGRAYVVDLSRIDERFDENGQFLPGLFETAKNALAGPANDPYGVGADDPRILWKSEPGAVGGSVAPVFDPYTGMLFTGNMLQVKVHSAIDPRVTMKVNLGDKAGLSEVGGVVPLGVPLPADIEQRVAGLQACDGTTLACKENASLAAFRLEVSLPGDMSDSLAASGNELWLAVESERVAGAVTEQTPDGFPRSHLRRTRRDGSAELAGRAATEFRFQRVVPDSLRTALRRQRGYNRFVSPWIVAIADPRASELYEWQNASTKQQKKDAGCDECERPEHLKDKDENDDVYELVTNGRFITVRPELANSSQTIFANTKYSYLGNDERLLGRFSTVMADTVRPSEVLVAAQNPPAATGAVQETTFLHSGEVEVGTLDLDAGGRAGFNVQLERSYRSRTLGGSIFGQGWDSSLLRRLRALPNGDVEFRDGSEVFRFRPDPTYGGYESPKGLFLKLTRTGDGWRLIDQAWRIAEFDDLGRLTSESDEFYDPQTPDSGNIIRYVYDESGRLAEIVDPVKRRSQLVYWNESDASAAGAYPGLVKQIVDWRNRQIDFAYDKSAGTLLKVQLPDVQNTGGGRPAVEYTYSSLGGSYTNQLELRTNLQSIKDPQQVAAGGPARVTFTYDAGSGFRRDRVLDQTWGSGETVTFTWQSPTSAITKDAFRQERQYSLTEAPKDAHSDRPHVLTQIERGITISSTPFGQLPSGITASVPATTSADRTITLDYTEEGLVKSETMNGVRSVSYSYVDVRPIAPGFVPGGSSVTPLGGPASPINEGISYQTGPNRSTFVKSFSANGLNVESPEPSRNYRDMSSTNSSVTENDAFDANGLQTETASSGGSDSSSGGSDVSATYVPVSGPMHARGRLTSKSEGGLTTTIDYPSPTRSVEKDARGVTTTIDYDAWERARHVVISGPDLLIDEQLDYDATGRLVRHIRKQDNATVTKNYVYDVVGRPLSETIDGVSGGGSETTSTTYDAAGRTIITNHPGGSITTARLDGFGRVISSETTTGGDPIVDHFAYDLDDNVVFATDLQTATASAYDAHGNQIGSLLIDGVKTEAVMNAWGRPTTIRQTTSAGAVLREATFQYTPAGQLQSMEMSSAGSSTRSATLTWDGAGRTTGMSAAGRATRRTYDNAGRLLQAEKGAGSAQGITDRFDGAEFSGHTGRLPQAGKRLEKGSSAYAMAMAYNTAADVTAHAVGNLQWEQSFDQDGNLIAARHPNRPPSTFDYDSRGFLKVETLPDGSLNQYTRHPTGALTSYLDPSSEVTETKTDLIGRPTRRDFRDGTSEVVVWEGRRVKSITDRQGRIQTFVYNAKGQIHQITGVSGVVLDTIEYDDAGRITKWSTPDAIIEYRDLDGEGRPAETVQTRLRNGAEVDKYTQRHTWNVHGERTSWTMPTYQGFSSMNPWTTSVTQQYDAAGNLTRIERAVSGGVGAASVLLDAEYRNERRPNRRTITTAAGETIDRQYGYDAASGLMIRMEATAGGEVVAGSEVAHDGLQKSQARLLGLSGGARFNAWSYDARNRLMWSALALDGEATPNGETLSSGDFRGALNRTRLTPADPPSLHFEEDPSGGHKLSVMQRGNVIEEFTFNGGERREDGRFIYAYDGKGRLVSATLKDAVSPRRARYFYDGRGRMVGRRLEYVPVVPIGTIDESHWKLEDRPSVLAGEQLPADSTFVWDPMDDQMVAIFAAGASGSVSAGPNGGLVRQFIHGGLRYDDPLEVAIADSGAPGGVKRLYPIFDEAGSKSLQVVVSEQGKIVSRAVAGGAYGEDEAVLTGPAIDKIAVTAKKDDAGNVVAIDVLVRSTEDLDVATLASGFRLAVVDGGGQALRTTTAAVSLHDRATAKWTLTRAEWDAFAGSSGTLSVAATSTARAATWGDEVGMLAAPEWASETRPVFSSAALPVEVRESLANLSSWLASIPASGTATATLYEVPTLYALATPRDPEIPISDAQLLLVSAAFHAQPFHDPFTRKNYVRARWFDPQSGTWLTPDPRGYRDSSNLYAYCGNDPVNCSDPTGEAGEDGEDDGWGTAAVSFVKSAAKTVAIGVAITATVAAAGISTPVIVAVGSVALVSSAAYNGYQRYQAGHADSVLEAVVMGVGDATGINTAIEAATCREIGTGEELSRSECAERWGTVAGLAVTGGLARPVARRANAAAAPAREAVKNAISRSLARPPPGAAAAAMARRVTRPVQRPVVLGETMGTRVRPVARAIGARTFKPRSTNPARWEANQRRWIRKQIASGRKIYDIGKHRGRPVDPRTGSNRSEYYRMEVDELTRAGYHREFVKWVSAYVDDGFGNMVRKNFRLYEWVR